MNSELQRGIRCVNAADADYPKSLFEIPDRPPLLYVQGRWPLPNDALFIGIVGARHSTTQGKRAAADIAKDLVRHGVVTVSGLALGIDAAAHQSTLDAGGWTVAVLGHGFKHRYPRENSALFDQIADQGTLITEFCWEEAPLSEHFPQRNRIISGLSRGVVVVEAGERSGASITARFAAEQGRDVFAVPGSIYSWQSKGCHRLIKEGATLVESACDLLAAYGISTMELNRPKPVLAVLSTHEEDVLKHLILTSLSVDELVERTGQPVERLAEVLLSLELKGRINSMPGHRYAIC